MSCDFQTESDVDSEDDDADADAEEYADDQDNDDDVSQFNDLAGDAASVFLSKDIS